MSLSKKPFTRGPRRAVHKLNKILEPFDKGVVLESDHIVGERLPDGRIQLKLTSAALKLLGLPDES